MVSTAAFHARVRGSIPGLGGLKETKMFLTHPRVRRGSVLDLRPSGREFRILCLEDSVLLQWLKLPAWKVGDCGFEPHSGLQLSKKQDVS